ncbi:MAG TPA: transglycosylase family protein [Solirubrobacteraceae bacterium]|nr:transglycosylase family protein [Solirubrobacteraceae bacterium]
MNLRRTALAGAAGALALVPAAPAHAVGPLTDKDDTIDPVIRMAERTHERARSRNVRLYRLNARLRGARVDGRRGAKLSDWTVAHLRAANARLERRNRALARVATPPHLAAIAACESGGNPRAVDASGTYRGKYQFDLQTWASVGGSGDPAAAPEAEQDRRAAILYARAGASPWPVCGM